VRGVFQAKEYASSMRALYTSSPVECIPEFFTDPNVLKASRSIPKIQVPKWCKDAEDFIKWHRRVLESERVSAELHHWIDLMFGHKLSGRAAVEAMNVPLKIVRSVRARSARILITSLKYYECHCITQSYHYTLKNYDFYYSLMSSNITKYLTRASRSNTGTSHRSGQGTLHHFEKYSCCHAR